jgi:uncharacterized Zn-binding protein involved in type VI secretion
MGMLEAARMGDKVAHTHAFAGFITGMIAGAVLAVGIALLAGATIATGGGALILAAALFAGGGGGALVGMAVGQNHETSGEPIATGASRTFIGTDRKPAARAIVDTVTCDPGQKIAEGSKIVFIENNPAARRTDRTECDGKITEGWHNVFIGKEAEIYVAINPEVPEWMVTWAQRSIIIGAVLGTGGALLMSGVLMTGIGFVGSYIAAPYGERFGSALGGKLFGPDGAIIGGYLGGMAAGMLGGMGAGRLGQARGLPRVEARVMSRALARTPRLAQRIAATRGQSPAHIAARRVTVRNHYSTTRSYHQWVRAQRSRPNPTPYSRLTRADYRRDTNSHMAGVDYRQPVRVRVLDKDTDVVAYSYPPRFNRVTGKWEPPREGGYVAYEEQSATSLGISSQVAGKNGSLVPREQYRATLKAGTQVLESTSSAKLDNYSVPGRVFETAGGANQVNVNTPGAFKVGPNGHTYTPTGRTASGTPVATTRQPGTYDKVPVAGDAVNPTINNNYVATPGSTGVPSGDDGDP